MFNIIVGKTLKQTRQELEQTKKLIQQKTKTKESYLQQQQKILEEIKNIDKQIKKVEIEIDDIEKKINQTKTTLSLLEKKLEDLNIDKEFYYRMLKIFVKKYVQQYGLISPFFEDNFYRRIKKDILKGYVRQFKSTEQQIFTTSKLKSEYEEYKNKLNKYRSDLILKKQQQKDLFVKKNNLLLEYKRKQKQVEQEIAQLVKTQKELESLLQKLQKEQLKKQKKDISISPANVTINRKFIKPLEGEVVVEYGKQQYSNDGSCIVRNGVILQGRPNENVVAVEDGKVLFVSNNFRSYGKIIILEHKDNIHTVYATLGDIFVTEGTKVLKKQIIGKTDSSGQVYFELRKNFVPVNPKIYFE